MLGGGCREESLKAVSASCFHIPVEISDLLRQTQHQVHDGKFLFQSPHKIMNCHDDLDQGWANFWTHRLQWVLKRDRGAGPGTDGVLWSPTSFNLSWEMLKKNVLSDQYKKEQKHFHKISVLEAPVVFSSLVK